MSIEEARELIRSRIWPSVRERFAETGSFDVYPRGDVRRIEYLDEATRRQIALWKEALQKADAWRTVVDGAKVRELKAAYPGVYPEVFRYTAYFPRHPEGAEAEAAFMLKLLKLKFPEAYELCCS